MTKKEAIAKIMESGDWREQDAISIVENEIKKNPDYLGQVKLVDVDKKEKKSKEPKQRQDKLKWKMNTKVYELNSNAIHCKKITFGQGIRSP